MSSWAPTKHKTTNWSAYNNSLKRRGSLALWLDPEMVRVPPPSGKRGRQQSFSDAAIQACLTLKVLFGMPLRQTTGFVQSVLRLIGLDWSVPDFSTLCRRQKTLNVSLPYRGGTGPLKPQRLAHLLPAVHFRRKCQRRHPPFNPRCIKAMDTAPEKRLCPP
ncbi:transposase, partial [Aestuariivita sp.]|uniref:transposase n=1 Tax=Aestuariivita sp. TaxID=1872407 RepID=UPI0025B7C288